MLRQCWGGADFWQSSFHVEDAQWWIGFHSLNPLATWHLAAEEDWKLIGWQLWRTHYLIEAYYATPNPSTEEEGSDLTPTGHYTVYFDDDTRDWVYEGYNGVLLSWDEEGAFLKGGSKGPAMRALAREGAEVGRARARAKGKGKGNPKGKGMGKGKNKGKYGKGKTGALGGRLHGGAIA